MRLAAIWAALWLAGAAQAQCRLALVLALDVSSSVSAVEYDLQRLGVAAALDAPEIRHAILEGGQGHVALAVFEWSGHYQSKLHLDWTALHSNRDIDAVVARMVAMTRSHDDFPTSIGQALAYAAAMLERGPVCDRRVIDISGDGVNNYGYGPDAAYRHFPLGGVTVNGLVILSHIGGVAEYYRDHVLHGPGAFMMTANGFSDYRAAMTRKLFREINDTVLGDRTGPATEPRG